MIKDMTSGSPFKLIIQFSIPLLIGNIFQQFYSMVDTIIVGRYLGVDALAAVGSTGSMTFLILGILLGLTSGFSVLVSQKFGERDEEGLKKAIGNSYILSFLFSILVTVLSVFLIEPILNMVNTPNSIYDDAYSYAIVILYGSGLSCFYNIMSSLLRALGDSKTPLYFLIISSILNIVLDIVFIVNLSMGVSGAALATIISQGVSGLLCLIYVYKKLPILKIDTKYLVPDDYTIKTHLRIGIPMAIQFSIVSIGILILQGAVNKFGPTAISAFTAASKVEQFVMQPVITFGVTMATYVGQNLGAKNLERIKIGVNTCVKINIALGIVAFIVLQVFGEFFINLFVKNPSDLLMNYATDYLFASAIFFIPLSLIFIYRNALQGMGFSSITVYASVLELIARAVISMVLPSIIGFYGICYAGPCAWICAASLLGICFYKKFNLLSTKEEYLLCNDNI